MKTESLGFRHLPAGDFSEDALDWQFLYDGNMLGMFHCFVLFFLSLQSSSFRRYCALHYLTLMLSTLVSYVPHYNRLAIKTFASTMTRRRSVIPFLLRA
jgi:hypothetical protein